MATLTDMEAQAIRETRPALWDALVKCGSVELTSTQCAIEVSEVFACLDLAQIEMIIGTVWDALRTSMQKQSLRGAIPAPLGEKSMKQMIMDDEIPF